ncbi:MAG: PAS domain S-box protein [Candidatus Polarisedimenticolia bacterium]
MTPGPAPLLVAAGDADAAATLAATLGALGYDVARRAANGEELAAAAAEGGFVAVVVLLDDAAGLDGAAAARAGREGSVPVVCLVRPPAPPNPDGAPPVISAAPDDAQTLRLALEAALSRRAAAMLLSGQMRDERSLLADHEVAEIQRATVVHSPALVFVKARDGRLLFLNRAFEQYLGLTREEILGRDGAELFGPEDAAVYRANDLAVLESGESREFLEPGRRGGEPCVFSSVKFPLRDASGRIYALGGISFDVTERERALGSLRESEERFRRVFESSALGIALSDSKTHLIVEANEALQRLLGYTLEELRRRRYEDLAVEGDREAAADGRDGLALGGERVRERRFMRKDGVVVQCRIAGSLVLDAAGKPRFELGIVESLEARKAAEEKIREQAALLDNARDAIAVRALDGAITYWNKGAERLYGWTAAEAVGRRAEELLYDGASGPDAEARLPALVDGAWTGEIEQTTKDGRRVRVQSRWTLVRDAEGRPKAFLVINTDVTEQRRLEAQLIGAQRMEALGTLAGGIAHDLNNVLAPIVMAAELLRSELREPRAAALVETIETAAQRGAGVVRQVLTFARGSKGERVALDPSRAVREVARIVVETFPRSIELMVAAPDNLGPVEADPSQLHQVLLNLLVNARDAMPSGGLLRLAARGEELPVNDPRLSFGAQPGDYVVFAVSDSGPGVPPELRERIFEPFFTTKEVGRGTGLGLSTVHAIVRGQGGFVRVDDAPGGGALFEVFLPSAAAAVAAAEEPAETPRGAGELILVVDDEPAIREVARRILERHGYATLSARDGVEAVALYGSHADRIALVLIDMMMPRLDGPAAIRAMQRIGGPARFVAITGVPDDAARDVLTGEVDAFVPKPFTAARLLAALHKVLHG